MFTPPYSRLTALLAAVIALATEFTDPAAYPVLLAAFGPLWTKYLIAACAVVMLVSRSVKEPTPYTQPKEQTHEDVDPARP